MPTKHSISPRTIHTVEVRSYEFAEKLREIAAENNGAVGKDDVFIFVADLELYPDLEVKELYQEAQKIRATWMWVQLMID